MSDRPAPARVLFAVSSATFDQTVAVAPALRRAVVGMPPESTSLSGDEAATLRWNTPGGAGVGGDIDGGGMDGDG